MENIQYLLYFFLIYYSIIISYFNFSLYNNPLKNKFSPNFVSVIIAVKNGSNSLPRLLQSLIDQSYNKKIEYIIVDDNSTDNSLNIIKKYQIKDSRIIVTSSKYGNPILSHKKKALDAGIKISNGEVLLFSDVDCILPNDWVSNMISSFSDNIHYIVGYSEVPHKYNLVTLFQKIDFAMLMNATNAAINKNLYWACSGQNQAYKKSIYFQNNGFNEISKLLQGDDTLFLQLSNKNINNFKAVFSFNKSNKVFCRQEKQIIPFLLQRIRWAGDAIHSWKFNKSLFFMSVSTFFTNFILALNILLYFLKFISIKQLILPFFIKFIIDFSLAVKGMKVHNNRYSIFEFIYWFLIQPFYIIIIGLGSLFQNQISWKGIKNN